MKTQGAVPLEGDSKEEEEMTQSNERLDLRDRFLDQDWTGALSDLKDEYTALELEDEIRMK